MTEPSRLSPGKITKLAVIPQNVKTASPENPHCQACGLYQKSKAPFTRAFVPEQWTHTSLFVVDRPGYSTLLKQGRAVAGVRSRAVFDCVKAAGKKQADVAVVSAVRCEPCGERKPTMQQLRACRPFLIDAIQRMAPNHVVALGVDAASAVVNKRVSKLTAQRGHTFDVPGLDDAPPVWMTYDLDSLVNGAETLRPAMVTDMQRDTLPTVDYPETNLPDYEPHAVLGCDTEFSPEGKLLTVGIADGNAALAVETDSDAWVAYQDTLRAYFANAKYFVGHYLWVDLDHIIRLGYGKESWADGSDTIDTLLTERMADENRPKGGYELETCLLHRTNVKSWKEPTRVLGEDATQWVVNDRKERCRLDAWASVILLKQNVQTAGVDHAPLRSFTHRVAATLRRVWLNGVMISRPVFTEMRLNSEKAVWETKDRLLRLVKTQYGMPEFDPQKKEQVRELVYEKLKLPVERKTKTTKEPAVDKTTLSQHRTHEVIDAYLNYTEVEKTHGLYFATEKKDPKKVPLCELMTPVSDTLAHLHVQINSLGARTGRRSSNNPNWQNFPKVERGMVVSRFVNGQIAAADYEKLEIIVLAWIAKEWKLYDYFKNRGGYIGIAKDLLHFDAKKGSREYTTVKSIVLGTNYNQKKWMLAQTLWFKLGIKLSSDWQTHVAECQKIREGYLRLFPEIPRYMQARIAELLRTQQVVSASGRYRRLPCPAGRDTPQFWHLINQAINFPVQSIASEITGSALVDVEDALLESFGLSHLEYHQLLLEEQENRTNPDYELTPLTRVVNEVHDEVTNDVHPSNQADDLVLIKQEMIAARSFRALVPDFDVDLDVDIHVAPSWHGPIL